MIFPKMTAVMTEITTFFRLSWEERDMHESRHYSLNCNPFLLFGTRFLEFED
ncbi:MAG: hypothetical protein LBR06_10200 [Bacteroidales bacterium]|jgi:hypothetical protein|nr:hypothetical protein [Bacteroidales bacterium]